MSDPPAWPMPPFAQVREFLPPDEHGALLEWTLSHQDVFRPAEVIDFEHDRPQNVVKPDIRVTLVTRKLGPIAGRMEKRLRAVLPELERATGTSGGATSIELELAAHGDGAHYTAHTDVLIGPNRKPLGVSPGEDRVLSAVYYFHRTPTAFSGGQLRLFRLNLRPRILEAEPEDFIDIDPVQNSLVAFPSWTTHEVRPVRCPSRQFADYRFALNCWFCRKSAP